MGMNKCSWLLMGMNKAKTSSNGPLLFNAYTLMPQHYINLHSMSF